MVCLNRKNILILLFSFVILSSLLAISYSQEITQDTVPDRRQCGSLRPKIKEECNSLNTNDIYCCFMTNSRGQNFCYRLNATEWTEAETFEIQGKSYKMDCNVMAAPSTTTTTTPPTSNEGRGGSPPTGNEARSTTQPTDQPSTNTTLPETRPGEGFLNNNQPITRRGDCGKENPSNSKDCTASNTFTEYCCHLTNPENNQTMCRKIFPPTFNPAYNMIRMDNTDYMINCDIQEGSPGTPCGIPAPGSPEDCTTSSSETNSCCHFGSDSLSYCFWLGYKADPRVTFPGITC
jgi:hypothetical protein